MQIRRLPRCSETFVEAKSNNLTNAQRARVLQRARTGPHRCAKFRLTGEERLCSHGKSHLRLSMLLQRCLQLTYTPVVKGCRTTPPPRVPSHHRLLRGPFEGLRRAFKKPFKGLLKTPPRPLYGFLKTCNLKAFSWPF